MKQMVLVVLAAVLLIGGCFNTPTKDDAKEIASVSATALGKSIAEQTAIEVKKAIDEGGLSNEKIAEMSKQIGDKAADATLSALKDYLEKKQKEGGENTPTWVLVALFALNKLQEFKRDGFLKKKDTNGDGVIDEKD